MASVASQLIEGVTAHAQSYSLEDAREICADGTYFPKNLRVRLLSKIAAPTATRFVSSNENFIHKLVCISSRVQHVSQILTSEIKSPRKVTNEQTK